MCGIAGAVGRTPSDRRGPMRAMRDLLVHRGPDSAGEYADEHAALAIRRLKVIDLATGDQPQTNEDASIWLVFNGEIYNYRELRMELAARGHALRTASDTEVVVHLYEELGEGCVERLEGMFAFALWDTRRRNLVLARDRLGKKPMVYHERDGELVFSSEHRSLLAGLDRRPGVDVDAIGKFLRLGYVPAPHDAFEGVRKLEPGRVLVWHDGTAAITRYWRPPLPGTLKIGEQEAAAELRRLMRRAVARRLIADVPIGAFLSGGVDSSAVVATMAELTNNVRTFTIGFVEEDFSELPHARRIAQALGTDHHEFIVRPSAADILPSLVRHYGEPFADSSAVPTFYLSKLTREHVTVALNGDGGDELFAGYQRYLAVRLATMIDRAPRFARAAMAAAARALPDSIAPNDPVRRIRRFLAATALTRDERYLKWLGTFDADQLADLVSPEFTRQWDDPELPRMNGGSDPVAAAQLLDLSLYLPDDLLVKVDIASMANSLEVRCPFLDRELVEFAIQLPTSLKIRGTDQKYLVKRAFAGIIPRENMYRRKQGFAMPVGAWLRGDLAEMVQEVVLSPAALQRGYFRAERLREVVTEHLQRRADHTHRLWSLLVLELWHREFVDGWRA